MKFAVICMCSSLGATFTCVMSDAELQLYPIHYALWFIILRLENPDKKGTP